MLKDISAYGRVMLNTILERNGWYGLDLSGSRKDTLTGSYGNK
jgi:hypothetical protein